MTPSKAAAWSGPAEVFAYKRLSEQYHSLTLVSPEVCRRAAPGQFVAVRAPSDRSLLLRRPFSIHRVDRRPGWAGTVEIVFDVRGLGTDSLARMRQHDVLDILGPLGRPFRLPREPTNCLLIGGGIGAAPLMFLAEELRDHGHRVDFILGGRTQEHILRLIEAKRAGLTVTITTDDGSSGARGVVTDVLGDTVRATNARVVYTCGPVPMLRAVAGMCSQLRVPCQVAWEEVMACGFGACLVCAVPVRVERDDDEGEPWAWARCCTEGPVFSASRIHWERVEYVPGADEAAEVTS
ncbi:MAG TPA: dihydroorotate dehydrogenase electron transfer subunit [Actinomycetota bacterium]|nr:dihydroorotate dehydrogenase electron transfer subunit [Actinomycetota bacterium]